MSWTMVRNSEANSLSIPSLGKCPRFDKNATVTSFFVGNVVCKTDLQKTYRFVGVKCSLLEGTEEESFSPCMEDCPLAVRKL